MELHFWSQIKNCENYWVSNFGNVGRIDGTLKKAWLRTGYPTVTLNKKQIYVHRLVAEAFISHDDMTKNIVNHIDGNKLNNHESNLEWVTAQENINHARRTGLNKSMTRQVYQCDMEGNIITLHKSIKEAAEATGASSKHIPSVCTGKRASAGGFKWKYLTDPKLVVPDGERVPDFPNYIVTKDGNVYNTKSSRLMVPVPTPNNYQRLTLSNNGVTKTVLIHRVVAQAYLKQPKGKNFVNHKDCNQQNNNVSNLEWCTISENMIHYHSLNKVIPTVKVIQYDMNENYIETFESIVAAAKKTGVDNSSIVRVCKGKSRHAGNYIWKYEVSDQE